MFSAWKDNHDMDPRLYREFPRRESHYLLKVHDLPFTCSSPAVPTKKESGNVDVGMQTNYTRKRKIFIRFYGHEFIFGKNRKWN